MKLILLCFALALSAGLCSAQDPMITFLNGPQYQIVVDDSLEVLSIPLQIRSDLDPSALQTPQLIHVGSPFATDDYVLKEQFNITLERESPWPIIHITFDTGTWLHQGSYTMLFAFQFAGSDQTSQHQIELVIPKGQLATPTTLIIPNMIPLFGSSSFQSTLTIKETTGRARIPLMDLALTPDGLTSPDGIRTEGHLNFQVSDTTVVEAGRRLELPFSLSGHFPIGKVSGTLEIESTRLDPAASFRVEVNTRRSYAVLIWTLISGLIFGYVVRILLASIIERNKARLPGFDLLNRIDQELKKRPDSTFQNQLTSVKSQLESDLDQHEARAIQDAVVARLDEVKQAIQSFNDRRDALSKAFNRENGLMGRGWSVPAPIEAMLASARMALESIETLIAAQNLDQADQQLTQLKRKHRADLQPAVTQYKHQTIQDLTLLTSGRFALPEATRTTLSEAIKVFESIQTNAPTTDLDLEPLLESTHHARTCTLQALSTTELSLRILFQNLITTLNDLPDPTPAQGFIDAMQQLIQDLSADISNPEHALRMLPGRLNALYNTMEDTLMGMTDDDLMEENTRSLLAKGKYEQAVRDLVQILVTEGAESFEQGDANTREIKSPSFPRPSFLESVSMPTVEKSTRFLSLEETELSIQIKKQTALKQLAWSQLLQTSLAGIGIVFFGFLTFSGSFVGSLQDFYSTFFWAFTLDVSVSTLLNLNKSKGT